MLFNSFQFIIAFLPLVLSIYWILGRLKLFFISRIWIVFSSLFFYGYWEKDYVYLIIISVITNYLISLLLINEKNYLYFNNKTIKKIIVLLGIFFNLALLGYYKYFDFFIENLNYLSGTQLTLHNIILPLAISFFTLQQIAFLVDSFEGIVKEKSFVNYAMFVTFFPQLIAGPIVHHKEMMPQFKTKSLAFIPQSFMLGVFIFSIGLFKKVIIADTLSVWADSGFENADLLSTLSAWATSVTYSFQLYFDFSGYTDMAIGLALLFNIKLPHNFNSPFISTNIIEFWSRWHMTLTNFFTTYIYTPMLMTGKKVTFFKAMVAIFITMQIAGIWHGAEWKYVVFGALHGCALVICHVWKRNGYKFKINKLLAWLFTFMFISVTFTIFRGDDLDQSLSIIQKMFIYVPSSSYTQEVALMNWVYLFSSSFIVFHKYNTLTFLKEEKYKTYLTIFLLLLSFLHLNYFKINNNFEMSFIYFNF